MKQQNTYVFNLLSFIIDFTVVENLRKNKENSFWKDEG